MELINGFNDRCILELLNNKPDLSYNERKKLKKLKYRYSNYKTYEEDIIKHLLNEDYLDMKGVKEGIEESGTGYWIPADGTGVWQKPEDIYYVTNVKGIVALGNGYYQSEYAEKFFKTKLVRLGIIVGAVAGFTSFLYNIYNLIIK